MADYNSLLLDIPGELHEASSTFAAKVPSFINYGQARICRELQIAMLNVEETGSFDAASPLIPMPSTAVAILQFGVEALGQGVVNLRPRTLDFLTVFWPDRSQVAAKPKYWAPFDDDRLIVAPTPATSLSWRLTTRKIKAPLGPDRLTNEITSRCYDLLVWACCARGASWLMDDRRQSMIDRYEGLYQRDKAVMLGNELEIRSDEFTERKPRPGTV